MDKPTDKTPLNDLASLADGELAPERQGAVAEHMAQHPDAARQVAFQMQLRLLAGKSLHEQTPPAPEELKRRIAAMLAGPALTAPLPSSTPAQNRRPSGWQRWRLDQLGWMPSAVAAVLLVGALLALQAAIKERGGRSSPNDLLNVSQVNEFASQHNECSRGITKLHNPDKFPTEIALMPDAINKYLGKPSYKSLDLSELGFAYQATGECLVPVSKSVHMLYQNAKSKDCHDSLSLWVAVYRDDPTNVVPDKIYQGDDKARAHPIEFWRHGDLIYYMVGDSVEHVHKAAEALLAGE